MPDLYLTPASIGFLTQIILALGISVYLLLIFQRRKLWNAQTIFLSAFLLTITIFVGLLFLDAALLPAPRLYAVYLENPVLAVALVCLLQFAYRFPNPFKPRKLTLLRIESYLLLGLSLRYAFIETQFALYRFGELLEHATVYYRPLNMDADLVNLLLWVPVVFFRQSLLADTRPADFHPLTWLRKLWNPQGAGARAAREFTCIYLGLAALGYANILRTVSTISTTTFNIALSIGILVALWLFASRYIHVIPGGESILVKLSAITLTLFLAVIGAIGWLVSPGHVAVYQPDITDRQTLRFTPDAAGGYAVAEVDFSFETNLGQRLPVETIVLDSFNPETERQPGLPLNAHFENQRRVDFSFPFYGKTYTQLYVSNSGVISLGAPFWFANLQAGCLHSPAIFPLTIELSRGEAGVVYARQEAERLVLTWDHLPAVYQPSQVFTFQVVLYGSGVFEITYNGLPQPILFNPDATPSANPWVRGITPGLGEGLEQDSVGDLAQAAYAGPGGLRQNFYLDFRNYLDAFLRPLAYLVLGISLFLLLALPLLLRAAITQPLEALLKGVRRMDAGDLTAEIAVQTEDELGLLTQAFNKMARTLDELVAGLEQRVSERTADLSAEMQAREQAQQQIIAQQRSLAALEEREQMSRQLHDGLGQVMGYINVQTQAARALLSDGQNEAAAHSLERVAQLAQHAHADIRDFILGLRTPVQAPAEGLPGTLETYVRAFRQETGLAVALSLPCEGALPTLPPAVEEQVLHILRETLTNVYKHARATRAELLVCADQNNLQLIVSDDGIGFDVAQASSMTKHFGLKIMRERAAKIGAELELRSAPGQGAKVILTVPLLKTSTGDSGGWQGLRVLLVDDSALFSQGLSNLLAARGVMVVGAARNGREAQELARRLRPEIIIMDLNMPECNGLEATRVIKAEFPEIKILLLTVSEQESDLIEAIRSGASGFLLKGMDANEFCTHLAALATGETVLPPQLAARVIAGGTPAEPPGSPLSERQQQILDLVALGMTYKEVGAALHLSEKSIKYHMGQILEQLHLKNRAEAVAFARKRAGPPKP